MSCEKGKEGEQENSEDSLLLHVATVESGERFAEDLVVVLDGEEVEKVRYKGLKRGSSDRIVDFHNGRVVLRLGAVTGSFFRERGHVAFVVSSRGYVNYPSNSSSG